MSKKLYTEEQVVRYAKDLKNICAEDATKLSTTEELYERKLVCAIVETCLPPLPEPYIIINDNPK